MTQPEGFSVPEAQPIRKTNRAGLAVLAAITLSLTAFAADAAINSDAEASTEHTVAAGDGGGPCINVDFWSGQTSADVANDLYGYDFIRFVGEPVDGSTTLGVVKSGGLFTTPDRDMNGQLDVIVYAQKCREDKVPESSSSSSSSLPEISSSVPGSSSSLPEISSSVPGSSSSLPEISSSVPVSSSSLPEISSSVPGSSSSLPEISSSVPVSSSSLPEISSSVPGSSSSLPESVPVTVRRNPTTTVGGPVDTQNVVAPAS